MSDGLVESSPEVFLALFAFSTEPEDTQAYIVHDNTISAHTDSLPWIVEVVYVGEEGGYLTRTVQNRNG